MAADQDHNEHTFVARRDALVGEIFDRRFRIDARIAAGGFGAIYRATHVKSGRQLALKVLHPNLTSDPGVVARFRREGAALTRLRDLHTITAYELGEAPDGTLYIVMELLRGESLYERYRAHGPMPWQRVFVMARAVCSSLSEAHALGIIHRDLKPTNIHLEPGGPDGDFVKVLDFGIAKILHDSDIDNSELTQAGEMIGTIDYMSPEQMVGGICDATTDLYTLGIVMYEMIAGRKPFDDANSAAAALAALLTTTPPRLSVQALVPAEVDRIVMRCLERQSSDRYTSAAELATDLDEVLSSGEEAVTTIDLSSQRSGFTTLKGMRAPTPPPRLVLAPVPMSSPVLPSAPSPAATAPLTSESTPVTLPDHARQHPAPATSLPFGAPGDRSRQTGPTPRTPRARPVTAPVPLIAPLAPVVAASKNAASSDESIPTEEVIDLSAETAPILSRASAPQVDRDPPLLRVLPSPRPTPPRATPPGPRAALADETSATPATVTRKSTPRPRTPSAPEAVPPKNLRDAYPAIHRLPPSPMRPPSLFDENPSSSVSTGAAYEPSRSRRRDLFVGLLVLCLAIVAALVIALLIADGW